MFRKPFSTYRNTLVTTVLVFFLVLGFLPTERAAADDTSQQIIKNLQQEAEACITRKDYAGARDKYREILRDYPDAINSQCGLIKALLCQDDLTTAQAETDKLLADFSTDPGLTKAVRNVANQYLTATQYAKAAELYQTAIDRDPGEGDILCQRGLIRSFIRLKDFTAAEAAANKLLLDYSTHPNITTVTRQAAGYYHSEKRFPEAVQLYQAAIDREPENVDILCQKGLVCSLIRLKDFATAGAAANKLVSDYSTDPEFVRSVRDVADCYRGANRHTEAIGLCQTAISRGLDDPDMMYVQRGLACSLIRQGDIAAAKTATDKLLADYATAPRIVKAMQEVAYCYRFSRRDEEALALYQKILEKNVSLKEQNDAHAGIACILLRQGDDVAVQSKIDLIVSNYTNEDDAAGALLTIAEEYYTKAIRSEDAESSDIYYRKSIELIESHLLGIIEMDPNGILPPDIAEAEYPVFSEDLESMAWYILGLNYWHLSQWFPAADAFMRSVEANPNHQFAGSMCWLVSDCYEKLKRDGAVSADEADPLIEWGYKALFDNYPDSRDVEYAAIQLGKIHLARGEPVSACVYFNWFLDYAFEEDGRIAVVQRILAGMEGGCR